MSNLTFTLNRKTGLKIVCTLPKFYRPQTATEPAEHAYGGRVTIETRFEGKKLRHNWYSADMLELGRLARNSFEDFTLETLEAWVREKHDLAKNMPLRYVDN